MSQNASRVFVFGTLKRGFPLHDEGLHGATCLGAYKTVKKYPMLVAGRWYAPMMAYEPGTGLCVKGELYEVDAKTLELLDKLESVHQSGNYREVVEVESLETADTLSAYVYVKSRELMTPSHTDYLEDYQDRRFVHPSQRAKED